MACCCWKLDPVQAIFFLINFWIESLVVIHTRATCLSSLMSSIERVHSICATYRMSQRSMISNYSQTTWHVSTTQLHHFISHDKCSLREAFDCTRSTLLVTLAPPSPSLSSIVPHISTPTAMRNVILPNFISRISIAMKPTEFRRYYCRTNINLLLTKFSSAFLMSFLSISSISQIDKAPHTLARSTERLLAIENEIEKNERENVTSEHQ